MLNSVADLKSTLASFGVKSDNSYYVSKKLKLNYFPQRIFFTDYYCINLVLEGNLTLKINEDIVNLQKKSALICTPSSIIKLMNFSDDYRMRVLFFEKDYLTKNFSDPFFLDKLNIFKQTNFKKLNLNQEQFADVSLIFDDIQLKSKTNFIYKDDFIRNIIQYLIFSLSEFYDSVNSHDFLELNDSNYLYHKFIELIQNHIYKHKEVQFYANQLCISEKYLIKVVKNASAKTPHQIIDDYLLKFALVLLNNFEWSISEIAFKLSFASVGSFSRFFKRNKGFSPYTYRKSLTKN